MRISELVGYRKHPVYKAARDIKKGAGGRLEAFVSNIKRLGYQPVQIGRGLYSLVFQHPSRPNEVIKLFHRNPSYLKWALYCRGNYRNNEHLTKIYSIKGIDDKTAFVRMEKLSPVTDRVFKKAMEEIRQAGAFPTPEDIISSGKMLKAKFPKLYQTIADMAAKFPDMQFWDFHEGNFMQRGKTIVITDPLMD